MQQGMGDKFNINMGKLKPTGQNTGRQIDIRSNADLYANRHLAEDLRDKGFSVSKTYK